jgi:signal transduction histidine kinase
MSVLIHGGAEPFGVLGAHTARRRHFTADDTHFLQAVANVLATSIERARGEVEVRRLQELARQRERLADLGAIAAQVVHEVGNPVAALSLQAELLQRRLGRDVAAAPKSVTGPAASIVAEIRRLERLVGDFKDFARQQRLDLASIDVARFLAAVADLWRPMAAAHRIDLTMRPAPALPAIMADEDKLHRVLDNLLKNAVEAIGKGPGAISLEATLLTRERLRISVSDTGAGLREGKATFRLFETTKPGGTGLGLSIARQIVLAHGGDLIGEPAVPHGTVFHIELPVRTPESR